MAQKKPPKKRIVDEIDEIKRKYGSGGARVFNYVDEDDPDFEDTQKARHEVLELNIKEEQEFRKSLSKEELKKWSPRPVFNRMDPSMKKDYYLDDHLTPRPRKGRVIMKDFSR